MKVSLCPDDSGLAVDYGCLEFWLLDDFCLISSSLNFDFKLRLEVGPYIHYWPTDVRVENDVIGSDGQQFRNRATWMLMKISSHTQNIFKRFNCVSNTVRFDVRRGLIHQLWKRNAFSGCVCVSTERLYIRSRC